MTELKATVFGIKPFEIHDGPGIRTTVFFKGCPLRCKWCHNPESFSAAPQLSFDRELCVSCMACTAVCDCHENQAGSHFFNRTKCIACGKCVSACEKDALRLYDEEVTVTELYERLVKDKMFWDGSNGGVTFSGGEPMLRSDFCLSLAKKLKAAGVHIALDSCGYVPRSRYEEIAPYLDLILWDIKAIDREVHKACTGVYNDLILDNIRAMDDAGMKSEIRYPLIPGMNDGEAEAISRFVSGLKHVTSVRVLPYHDFAISKYQALDIPYPAVNVPIPTGEEIKNAEAFFEENRK